MCETFHGPRPEGMEVAHLNGIPGDCRAENLAWKSHVDNIADKIEHDTVQHGERNGNRKLTEIDVKLIREAAQSGESFHSIAIRFQVTRQNVGYIVRRETWRHV